MNGSKKTKILLLSLTIRGTNIPGNVDCFSGAKHISTLLLRLRHMVMVTSVTWSTPVNRSVSVNITNLVAGFISLFLRVLVPSFSIGMKLGVSPPLHTTSCQTYMNANINVNHTLSAWVMESGSPGWCDRVLSCNLKIYYMLS